MGDVQTAPTPAKDVSDRSASAKQGDQSWNGGPARDIWGKPPVPGQRTDSSPTQQTEAGKDSQSTHSDATSSSANDQAAKQTAGRSVKSSGPKEATTNANDSSRANNENDQSQPTLKPQDQTTVKGQKDAPQLVAEVPQEAPTTSNAKQYSLPDGSTGAAERTNGHDSLKLGVRITPEQEQKIVDTAFHLRHEIGHDFNLNRDMPLSEKDDFQKMCNSAYDAMGDAEQHKLGLTKTDEEYAQRISEYNKNAAAAEAQGRLFLERVPLNFIESRDEVFSDLYAHTTGEPLKTDYSQDIENAFSQNCEGFVQAAIERYINTLKKKAGIQ